MDMTSSGSSVSTSKIKAWNPGQVTAEQGLECLNRILEQDVFPESFLEKFRDKVFDRSSAFFEYGAFGRFSPAVLRLLKILLDFRRHFGNLDGKNVVEIGGDSGGQREVLTSFFKLASYTVYEAPPEHPVSSDLVISHFAFGESSAEAREAYCDKILSLAPGGYLTCPATEELSRGSWGRIPGAKMIAEEPSQGPDRFVLIWGHRPIAAVSEYRRNVVSQFGEDGVLEEIFLRIGSGGKLCVEFGAWDGKYVSNTWNFWARHGWSAVLIESDAARFRELVDNTRDFPQVRPLHAFVTDEPGMFDGLLKPVVGDRSIDLLSVDIDGDDYHVFRPIEKYLPRVLVIEFNATIPEKFHLLPDPGAGIGASARALHFLTLKKGYTTVAVTGCNLICVRNDEFEKLGMKKLSLREMMFPQDALTYLMTPYESVPFASRVPAFLGLGAKLYRKKLPPFTDSNRWHPVHLRSLHLAQAEERQTLTPSSAKQRLVIELAHLHLAQRLVRTGSVGEKMEEDCRGDFKETSAVKPGGLDEILAGISEPCVFWLNNPFTPGQPDRMRLEEIRKDLKSLLTCPLRSPVILIDHARLFNGEDGYPHIDRIEEEVRQLRPDLDFVIREDVVRICPARPATLKQRNLRDLRDQKKRSVPNNRFKRWLKTVFLEWRIRRLENGPEEG